jgi:hypothetical protein
MVGHYRADKTLSSVAVAIDRSFFNFWELFVASAID